MSTLSFEANIVQHLNNTGAHHKSLVHLASNDLVYLFALLGAIWFVQHIYTHFPPKRDAKVFITALVYKGFDIVVLPMIIAVGVSETISKIYVRNRPFVSIPSVHLLVPHGADGGMPSHHMVFMIALATIVIGYTAWLGWAMVLLAIASAFGRVAAGIHYPSDIIVGALVGWLVVRLWQRLITSRWSLARF